MELATFGERLGQGDFRNIVVCAGAGLSTSVGIPDFRSPNSGLYANLKSNELPSPEMIFDIDFFRSNPQPFIALSRNIWPGRYNPTLGHCFLKLLDDHGILRRVYTQNIDDLELMVGLPRDKVVRCHGSIESASCIDCRAAASPSVFLAAAEANTPSEPSRCTHCGGLVKPDIVFFGEPLPQTFDEHLDSDLSACDLLLVVGTSLAVYPFATLPDRVGPSVPRVLLNRRAVGSFNPPSLVPAATSAAPRDVITQYYVDVSVARIADTAGWRVELEIAAARCGTSRRSPPPADVVPLLACGLSPCDLVASATGFVVLCPACQHAGLSSGWLPDWIPQVARAARAGCDPVHGRQRVHVVRVTWVGGGGGSGAARTAPDSAGAGMACRPRPWAAVAVRAALGGMLPRCAGGVGGSGSATGLAGHAHVAEHALRVASGGAGAGGGEPLEQALDGLCAALDQPLSCGRWAVLQLGPAGGVSAEGVGASEWAAVRAAAERLVAWYPTAAAATVYRKRCSDGVGGEGTGRGVCGSVGPEDLASLAALAAADVAAAG